MALTRYGLIWENWLSDVQIEIEMLRRGGEWTMKNGQKAGRGIHYHFHRLQELLWPTEKKWHRWNELELECYLKHRTIGEIGPSSSGKTCSAATNNLADYYCWPECTTVLVCSTTKERLEDRVFGEIKKFHRVAKERWPELPGNLIEGRGRICTDDRSMIADGRDFRNGIIAVAAKKGGDYVGLGEFVGIKNKRVRVIADELQLLPKVFVISLSNLDKNPDFKCVGLGNPKETTDALGVFCEPAFELGGWDSGIDQTPKTKTWKTRRPDGICIQLVGSDSPNLDGKLGIPLISQTAIDRDVAEYGKDSVQFTMMNEGMMPRGQGSRRVLTRQLVQKNGGFDAAQWENSNRTKIAFLDAAYRGVGGDRCIYGELEFGEEVITNLAEQLVSGIISQRPTHPRGRQIISLTRQMLVPIVANAKDEAEEQIVNFVREKCRESSIAPENFFFDAGMRTSLVSAFAKLWSPQVEPIDFGGKPSDRPVSATIRTPCKDYYSKFVTELWFSVRLIVEGGQFRGLTESVVNEGCQREWKITDGNKIEIEPKDKMKEKTGRSPDLFDALVCGVEGARKRGFIISRLLAQTKETRQHDSWKRDLKRRSEELAAKNNLNHAAMK